MVNIENLKEFTKSELRRFDGKGGRPAYVAFRGQVFDVTHSYHWKQGEHWASHSAGEDLTGSMGQAPHSEALLFRCPVVGTLTGE